MYCFNVCFFEAKVDFCTCFLQLFPFILRTHDGSFDLFAQTSWEVGSPSDYLLSILRVHVESDTDFDRLREGGKGVEAHQMYGLDRVIDSLFVFFGEDGRAFFLAIEKTARHLLFGEGERVERGKGN